MSITSGNVYTDKFLDLINQQPYHLTRFKKIVRIDKLLCYEMEEKLTINPDNDQLLFCTLTVLICNYYFRHQICIEQGINLFKEINEYCEFMLDEDNIINLSKKETAPRTLEYIKARNKLINILEVIEL